jgi:hypothetical protein
VYRNPSSGLVVISPCMMAPKLITPVR